MTERWRETVRVRQVRLDAFTPDELGAVTLDPRFLPGEARGPALPAAAPLLAAVAAQQEGPGDRPVPPLFPPLPAEGAAAAAAAAALERRGYLRPGVPAPAAGPVPDELAGWSADPAGLAGPRAVAIAGDLGIVMRMRALPYWMAEVAGRFARVAQVRVAHPPIQEAGPIMLRRLIVATGTGAERWVLDGERGEHAVPVTVDQVGERLEAVLEPSGQAADQPG